MLFRFHLVPSSLRPIVVRNITYATNSLIFQKSNSYLKSQSDFIHCRWKSSNQNEEHAITNSKENYSSQVTISKKVKETTKDAGYLGIIIAGIGVTGFMFYAIFRELFSKQSPNSIYSDALKICRNDSSVIDALGEPIKGYGEMSSRGRRRHVSFIEYEKDGKDFMRLKFYVEGTRKSGTVHVEMIKDEKSKYEYRYLFVDLDGYPQRTIILKDNRQLDGNLDTIKLDLV